MALFPAAPAEEIKVKTTRKENIYKLQTFSVENYYLVSLISVHNFEKI